MRSTHRIAGWPLLAAIALLAGLPAHADSSSSSAVSTASGLLTSNGTTSSIETVDAKDFAQSFVNVSTGIVGAAAQVDGKTGFGATTSTSHGDTWLCNALVDHQCITETGLGFLTVQFHVFLEGDTTGRYYDMKAHYGTNLGDAFSFEIGADGVNGVGPDFVVASFNGNSVPVSVTTDASGNSHFSVDFTATVRELAVVGAYAPGAAVFFDSQSVDLAVGAANGPSSVDALHTFGVSLASLDAGFPLVSVDGRIATSVPEPQTWAMGVLGLGLLAMRLRRR